MHAYRNKAEREIDHSCHCRKHLIVSSVESKEFGVETMLRE